jgi:hypothetical protein
VRRVCLDRRWRQYPRVSAHRLGAVRRRCRERAVQAGRRRARRDRRPGRDTTRSIARTKTPRSRPNGSPRLAASRPTTQAYVAKVRSSAVVSHSRPSRVGSISQKPTSATRAAQRSSVPSRAGLESLQDSIFHASPIRSCTPSCTRQPVLPRPATRSSPSPRAIPRPPRSRLAAVTS